MLWETEIMMVTLSSITIIHLSKEKQASFFELQLKPTDCIVTEFVLVSEQRYLQRTFEAVSIGLFWEAATEKRNKAVFRNIFLIRVYYDMSVKCPTKGIYGKMKRLRAATYPFTLSISTWESAHWVHVSMEKYGSC
ncbi:hypothetical protein QQP08_005626 [Theobroma cacao]|nr:hypothetical protein QQP08_005626 [Theobroma cacao]